MKFIIDISTRNLVLFARKIIPELPHYGERAGDSYLQLKYATNSSIYAFLPSITRP